ncbi:MurR/RpiR family transcriptional regulator [Pseudogemmobacter bohemicus]|uniref:MurR/RpiR family transcriptional regulator n=1 Tax=Pseudogemmobacter bohemicus TaxID=2250708 RepID=UPI0018E57080|nr:MurR/RpiR family transcriptional regulator [Pseudogemmobacter bohemicus]
MTAKIGIIEQIQGFRGGMKPALQAVADAILADPEGARTKNIKDLAAACGTSEASISRFVRSIGLDNYRAFQLRMVRESSWGAPEGVPSPDDGQIYENIGRHDNAQTILHKVAHRTSDLARACLTTLDPERLNDAARMICAAEVVYIFAAGSSALAAENALLRFARIGKPSIFHRDRNNQLLIAGALRKGALAIGISDSGRTQQTVAAMGAARQAGAATIAMTAFPDSPLARQADLSLITPAGYMPGGEEPLYESMVSKYGQLMAIDALYSLVAVQDFDAAAAMVRIGDPVIQQSRTVRRQHEAE